MRRKFRIVTLSDSDFIFKLSEPQSVRGGTDLNVIHKKSHGINENKIYNIIARSRAKTFSFVINNIDYITIHINIFVIFKEQNKKAPLG